MSLTFEQYSDKSFVVRGDKLNNADARKKLTQSLQGNCIWNTRLKNGKGLLVQVNDNNRKVLDDLCGGDRSNSMSVEVNDMDKDMDMDKDNDPRDRSRRVDDDDDEPLVERSASSEKSRRDEEFRSVRKSPRLRDPDDDDEDRSHRRRSRRDDTDDEDEPPRRSPRKSKQKHPATPPKRSRTRKHRDSPDSPSESELESPPRKRSKSSGRTPRSKSDSRGRTRSRDSSSSDEDDSSEDERIQKSIRRKGKMDVDEKRDELDTMIDSDLEDVVSLSRRVRLLTRKLREVESRYSK